MFNSNVDSSQPVAETAPHERPASASAWYGLAILVLVAFFAFVDRQIIILLTEPIRHDFALSDTQIGLLQGVGVALFAGVASLPLGWVADRVDRRFVLAACILVWSGATAMCGMATSFPQLLAATIGLGIGEAGLVPVIYGLIPDLFPQRQRVLANSIFAVANLIGNGAGMALGGALMHLIDAMHGSLPPAFALMAPWRLAFIAVALPAPLVALMMGLIRLRRGRTGPAEAVHSHHAALKARDYFRDEAGTMIKFFGAIGLVNLGFVSVVSWVPVIVVRNFGATPAAAGGGMGAAAIAGSLAGCLIGGVAVRQLRRRYGLLAPLRVCEFGIAAAAALAVLLLLAQTPNQIYAIVAVQVAAIVAGTVLFPTIMQDISPAHLRSRVAAIGVLVSVVVQSCSPVLIGLFSDHLSGVANGLLIAVVVMANIGFLLATALMYASERAVRRAVECYA